MRPGQGASNVGHVHHILRWLCLIVTDQIKFPLTPPQSNLPPPSVTDSKSSHSTESRPPKDPQWIGHRLRTYNMLQNEPGSLEKYPEFAKHVQHIINRKRESTTNPESAKKFRQVHQYLERANEDTLLQNILPLIIKPSRTVRSRVYLESDGRGAARQEEQEQGAKQEEERTQEAECTQEQNGMDRPMRNDAEVRVRDAQGSRLCQPQGELEYVVSSFWEDGLLAKMNCEFRKSFLPRHNNDEELAKAMAKVDGMTNPRPDYTYGIRINQYRVPDDVSVSWYTDVLLEIVPILHHPFFIIEGKSDRGSQAEAENQVCRGGATLINAARQLLERIGMPDDSATGPDQRTFVYSATLSPGLMDIWVHWAELRATGGPIFHMHVLESVSLKSPGAVGKLRRITHNILDWGCVDRSPSLRKIYDQIYEYERRQVIVDSSNKRRRVNNDSMRAARLNTVVDRVF